MAIFDGQFPITNFSENLNRAFTWGPARNDIIICYSGVTGLPVIPSNTLYLQILPSNSLVHVSSFPCHTNRLLGHLASH
jgi:hypothetical protein